MTEALAVRTQSQLMSMGDTANAGQLLAQASFLGTKNMGEGFVVMHACQQEGMSLIGFQQKYHFRQGRFSMQAHAMLAELVSRGGKYKIVSRTPDRCAIEFSKDGNTYLSDLTWADALNEPFVYEGNESKQLEQLKLDVGKRTLKNKYATTRARMQMMWARVISDGVVVVDPGARGGIYTPEETEDFLPAPTAPGEAPKPLATVPQFAPASAPVAVVQTSQPPPSPAIQMPAPVVAAVVTDVEPNPFKSAAAAPPPPPAGINFSLCPIQGLPITGKLWSEFATEDLQMAATVVHPDLLPEHYNAIRDVLASRGVK